MKNYVLMTLLLMASVNVFADVNGGVGYASDYFFRGTSQTLGQPSASAWLDWNNDQGVYAGAWAGQVNFNDDASLESNIYVGKETDLTNQLSFDFGFVQYRYNHSYNNLQELYVGIDYGVVSLYHYVDTDARNDSADFTQISYNLWFVPLIDASISYGYIDKDNDHVQLDFDYAITDNLTVGVDILGDIIKGDHKAENTISLGISYNF